MRRTRSFRRKRKILFISFVKNYDKEISPSTISKWIVDTVRFAYDQKCSSTSNKICAHELRALSESFEKVKFILTIFEHFFAYLVSRFRFIYHSFIRGVHMQCNFGSGLTGKTNTYVFCPSHICKCRIRHVRVIRANCSITSLDSPYIRSIFVHLIA